MQIDGYSDEFLEFVSLEDSSDRRVDLRLDYVDMVDDLNAGLLLSQILYWHRPPKKGQRKPKLRVKRNGIWWIAKERSEWWKECRLREKQVDRALGILKDKGYIAVDYFQFNSKRTMHICLNQAKFLADYKVIALSYYDTESEGKTGIPQTVRPELPSDVNQENSGSGVPQTDRGSSPMGDRVFPKQLGGLPQTDRGSSPMGNPMITETTTETTTKTTTEITTEGKKSVQAKSAVARNQARTNAAPPVISFPDSCFFISSEKETEQSFVEEKKDSEIENPSRDASGFNQPCDLGAAAVKAYCLFWNTSIKGEAATLIRNTVTNLPDWDSAMKFWSTVSKNASNIRGQLKVYNDREWEQSLTNKKAHGDTLSSREQAFEESLQRNYASLVRAGYITEDTNRHSLEGQHEIEYIDAIAVEPEQAESETILALDESTEMDDISFAEDNSSPISLKTVAPVESGAGATEDAGEVKPDSDSGIRDSILATEKVPANDATISAPRQNDEEPTKDDLVEFYRRYIKNDPTPEQVERIHAEVEDWWIWTSLLAIFGMKKITDFDEIMRLYNKKKNNPQCNISNEITKIHNELVEQPRRELEQQKQSEHVMKMRAQAAALKKSE